MDSGEIGLFRSRSGWGPLRDRGVHLLVSLESGSHTEVEGIAASPAGAASGLGCGSREDRRVCRSHKTLGQVWRLRREGEADLHQPTNDAPYTV